jgi:CheY-like chemotaxis protein
MTALRVLIVEDDAIVAMLYGEVLAGMGYEVCATESDEAGAVTAAIQHSPDLMIVDERLGDGSGLMAVEEILKMRYIPHVFVSGHTARIEALKPRAVVIRKPFHEADLASAIQQALAVTPSS